MASLAEPTIAAATAVAAFGRSCARSFSTLRSTPFRSVSSAAAMLLAWRCWISTGDPKHSTTGAGRSATRRTFATQVCETPRPLPTCDWTDRASRPRRDGTSCLARTARGPRALGSRGPSRRTARDLTPRLSRSWRTPGFPVHCRRDGVDAQRRFHSARVDRSGREPRSVGRFRRPIRCLA